MILTVVGLIELTYSLFGTFIIGDGIYLSWGLNGVSFIIIDFALKQKQNRRKKLEIAI